MVFIIHKSMVPNLDFENTQGISILIYTKIFLNLKKN